MRFCRFQPHNGDRPRAGVYSEEGVYPLDRVAAAFNQEHGTSVDLGSSDELLALLPPEGASRREALRVIEWFDRLDARRRASMALPAGTYALLLPIPRPNKLFLLAGNYVKHMEEMGRTTAIRAETFPYVFMKPPSTTLVESGKAVAIPPISPDHIDWELELAVVIGKKAKYVSEMEALQYVAGYTIVNDVTDRKFRPNPTRKTRERDDFFDWLHGKWMDGFCPCGPCIASADAIRDPQKLEISLSVNGIERQRGGTAEMVFPVAAVISFLSTFVTLEPGDIISTGTPHGVGNASKTYLKPGDLLVGRISGIGILETPIVEGTMEGR